MTAGRAWRCCGSGIRPRLNGRGCRELEFAPVARGPGNLQPQLLARRNRQHDPRDNHADDAADDEDGQWFDELQGAFGAFAAALLVELGQRLQHLPHLAGFFAHRDQIAAGGGDGLVIAQHFLTVLSSTSAVRSVAKHPTCTARQRPATNGRETIRGEQGLTRLGSLLRSEAPNLLRSCPLGR